MYYTTLYYLYYIYIMLCYIVFLCYVMLYYNTSYYVTVTACSTYAESGVGTGQVFPQTENYVLLLSILLLHVQTLLSTEQKKHNTIS